MALGECPDQQSELLEIVDQECLVGFLLAFLCFSLAHCNWL